MTHEDGFFDYGPTDDDELMTALERKGQRHAALRKAGKCGHGWIVERDTTNPNNSPEAHGLEHGQVKCLHCGAVFADIAAWRKVAL